MDQSEWPYIAGFDITKVQMSSFPTGQDFAEWMKMNAAFIEDLAFRHYLQLGRGVVVLKLDSRERKTTTTYLPAEGVPLAYPDGPQAVASILKEIERYDPQHQFVCLLFGNDRSLGVGIFPFTASSTEAQD